MTTYHYGGPGAVSFAAQKPVFMEAVQLIQIILQGNDMQ